MNTLAFDNSANVNALARFYVDFSTKLVSAERLLWERALKASDSSSSGGMDPGDDGEGMLHTVVDRARNRYYGAPVP